MMHWQYTPYVLPLLVAAIISAAIAFYAWRHRSTPGATPLVVLMLAVVVWSLGYAMELPSPDLATKIFWSNVNFLGIVIVPTAWLAFVLQYTGRENWLKRRNLALLAVEPLIVLLLVWTNDLHHLFWSDVRLDTSGPFPMLDPTFSTGFWVHAVYSYLSLSLGTFVLIQTLVRSPRLYRGQAIALLVAALVPWVGNVLHISGLSPFPHLDLTPFAFTLTGLALAWGLFRFRLLDIVPVARNAVLESMGDGMIVLDAQNRIVDLNPAAGQIIGRPASEVLGQPAASVLSDHLDLAERYCDATEAHAEIVLGADEARRHYDLRISPLHDRRDRLTGRLVVLHDVTGRKQAEEALRESEEKYRSIVESTRDVIMLTQSDGVISYVSPACKRVLGYDVEDLVGQQPWIIHPDDLEKVKEIHYQALAGEGGSDFEYRVKTSTGETKWVSHSWSPVFAGGKLDMLVSVVRDVTGRKRAEEELRTREHFLECLSEVSQQLLRADDLAEELPAILCRLGETAGVCRTYLFENYSGPKGELLCSQRYEWCAPGVEPQIDKPEQHNSPYVAGGFARWMEILGRGAVIAGATADLPESERAILESQGIRSVLVIPLFVSGTWYGFIGFDVCDQVREWQQVEIDLLRAAAGDIASTIEREQASRQAQALAEAAAALTATLDLEQVLDRILEQVGRVVSNDAANVMLIEGDQARVVRWRGYERFGSEELISAIVFRVSEVPNLQQMVESGEPMVIIDTAAYPGWAQVPTQEWLRSYAAAPIVVRGEVIGFLNVDSATPGFFTQAHIVPLRAFADYAAAAIENARLFEAANQRVAELEAVRQASLSLTSSLELPLVLEAILEHALQLVSADDAHIFLYNAGRLTFGAALWAGGRQQEPYAEPRPDGLTYTVAHSGERVVVSDMNDHPLFQGGQWAGAIVGLPLRVGGQVHGVMNVAYEKPHVFSENELGVLELLADHAAIAIENARLFDDLTHEKKRLELLYGLARALTESLSLEEVAGRALRQACSAVGAFKGTLWLLEPGTDRLHLVAASGCEAESLESLDRQVGLRVGRGLAGWVAAEQRAAFVADVSQDEHWFTVDGLDDWVRSALVVPLLVRDRLVGVLSLHSERLNAFDETQHQLVEVVAAPVAIAIQNAQLYHQVTRRVREQTLLNRISGGFGAALNVDSLTNCALEGLQELVAADRTYFVTTDPDACTWETTHELVAPGIEPDIGLHGAFDDVQAELEALLSGQPFAVSDIATDSRVEDMRETYRALGMQSMLLMPVQARGRLYGALGFDSCRERHVWQPDEIRLLEGVAHQLELALENVRLLEEARLRADELAIALAQQEELDCLKDEFIQNVSHELRSPLALVCGYAEMLDAGELGELQPEQQQPVAVITRRAHMLSDLVQDITLILETEVNPPEAEPIPLDELALAAVEDFQVVTRQTGLTLQAEIAPHLPPVSGSPIYLRRVLDNLIGNAAKFTPEGGTITVRLRQEGQWVALEVSDTGIGMPADKLERVFERFYQVDGSTKRKYGGVGLGLALVKEIVETCGGSVTVESQVGEGTTFTVLFPIAAGTEEIK